MTKLLLFLERKKLARGSKTTLDIVVKVFKWLAIVYFSGIFFFLGIGAPALSLEFFPDRDVISVVSQFAIYYFVSELMFRYFFQKLPVADLKVLLIQPIPKRKIIRFFISRSYISIFNIVQFFFFIPFLITCIATGLPSVNIILWVIAMYCIVCSLHFVVILMESYAVVFYVVAVLVVLVSGAQYYNWFDLTIYTQPFFYAVYQYPISVIGFILLPFVLSWFTFSYYKKNIYLDNLMAVKIVEGETQDMTWLDRFGKQAVFLKNDIKLMIRNKRAKTTILTSILFVFYGFLLVKGEDEVPNYIMYVIAAFMVSGGFMMLFGQYVPSWDSSYFPLMMTQNIKYEDYLASKWLLIALGTFVSTVFGLIYLLVSTQFVYLIFALGIFNIGITSFIVLVGGAYLKSPVDLSANKNVFGDKNAFSVRLLLVAIPQLGLPILFFWIGFMFFDFLGGVLLLVIIGIIGILCRKYFFSHIVSLYVKEKYSTIEAFKKG